MPARPSSPVNHRIDRVVLTGGSSGIGNALLHALLTLPEPPAICNLSRSAPTVEGAEPPRAVHHLSCDLADEAALAKTLPRLREWTHSADEGGRLLLVNNSGFGGFGPFPEPDAAHNLRMIDLNVRAPVELTAALAGDLEQSGGTVVHIASTAAFQPTPYLGVYGASKAFLLHWGLALAEEWKDRGVRVLTVCPGPTGTRFFEAAGFREAPLGKRGGMTAEKVAAQILRALDGRQPLLTTGVGNRVLSMISGRLPRVWAARASASLLRKLRLERYQEGREESRDDANHPSP